MRHRVTPRTRTSARRKAAKAPAFCWPLDPVTNYARDVVARRILAGPHVRAACARHLRDLQEGPGRGLRWDPAMAEHVINFFPTVLRLNGGEHEGTPFQLHV